MIKPQRNASSARTSKTRQPIYQEEDPSKFWEVDLSFRPIDLSVFGMWKNQGFRHNFSSYAEWEKTYGYQLESGTDTDSDSDSDSDSGDKKNDNKLQEELLRTTQLVYSYQDGKGMVPKLREPRNLYALAKELGPQQAARWPADIQVLEERVKHIRYIPQEPEPFYKHSGGERTPMVRGEENGGRLVYMYEPRSSFFVRSRVGGLRSGPQKCHVDLDAEDDKTLIFDSRFESGNLAKAVQTSDTDYELWLRYDLYTNKHTQWFYFRVSNTRPNVTYRFTIVNFMKSDSLYNFGMKPLMYSEKNAQQKKVGWIRGGSDIKYYKNNLRYSTSRSEKSFYSLTWTVQFQHKNDTVYFAHCFPYTYTDLQDYLLDLSNDPIKNKICKQRVLCRTLAGNLVYVLTITSPSQNPEDIKHKKAVVITARVHPGECNSSWMMKGFLDYLCGNSADAKLLRDTFIFKIVPMLNPDGVIVGNYRCSLAGRDLNRNYKTVLKDSYPSVWHTKNMIRKLLQEREIIVYCDLHGHSRKQNVFIYGCENRYNPDRRLKERIFPLMLNKNAPDKFKFESCKFKVQKSKEGTGRIVMWNMGIMNSYTMEATFCGSTLGKKKGFHFSMADFEALGYHFCDTLLDYCDPDNTKSKNILIELEERLKKEIMIKLQRTSTQEVDLSDDYISSLESSDGGSDSSVSDGPPVHLQFTSSREDSSPVKKKKKLKSKKERDRVRAMKPEEPPAKPKVNDRPSSDHVCEKKSAPVTGHVQSHARQEKLTSAGMKYTLAVKRPKSHEEHTGQSGQSALADGKSDERSRRNDYLEALTHAYLRNGLLNQESAAPHFRYSGNKVQTSIPFNLEGLCPHHEQTFAAQYMAQQIQNMNSGETTLDDIVRSQITHQASISPIARQPLQRHILEVSAAQQRQQDMLQEARKHGDKSGKFYRPRAQVPSATLYNYAESYEALQRASAPGDSGIQEQPEPEPAPVPEPEPEKLNQDMENKGSTPDDDSKKHAHKAKHKERGGRKSRMGMRDSDDDLPPANDGPDYVADPHKRTTPRVKSARGGTEMDSAIESIKELRQSLANNAMQQNLSPTTGGFIKRLMKETNEEIKELTNEIKHDIECEKKKERDKTKSHNNSEPQKVSTDNTHVEDLSGSKSKESSHNDYKRLEIENYGTGPRNKSSHSKDNSNIIVEDKKLISRLKSRSVTNFDRNYERTPKWKEPNLMVSGDTNNYSSLNVQGTGNEASEKKPGATTFELGHATSVSNSLGFFKHSYLPSTTSIATQTAKYVGNTSKVEMPPDHPIRLADTNGYGPSFGKSKSAKEFREGSVSVLTGSRDDRKPSEKLFEQTKRVKSAKSGRHSVGKMMVAPTILTETVPTKIQLMISQDHQEEKAFGGQFLPLSRTIRAPFYRNNSKKKQ